MDTYAVGDVRTWRERLLDRLFPSELCPNPEGMETASDVVICITVARFSWLDRLRILFTGRVLVESRTATQNPVGWTSSSATAYPTTKADG